VIISQHATGNLSISGQIRIETKVTIETLIIHGNASIDGCIAINDVLVLVEELPETDTVIFSWDSNCTNAFPSIQFGMNENRCEEIESEVVERNGKYQILVHTTDKSCNETKWWIFLVVFILLIVIIVTFLVIVWRTESLKRKIFPFWMEKEVHLEMKETK